MAGVGKLLKQAQKMQKRMEAIQEELAAREIDISHGGGAISLKINAQGHFLSVKIDPEFLKEDAALIEETLLEALKEATAKAREVNDEEMGKVSSGFNMPGLF
jgi:DNA-binding YbaB/EbfC family protein